MACWQFIEGAEESAFTDGGLCVKGYAYPRRVYSPDRIKYPMKQIGRFGNWQRISWDEAMDEIAGKILEIKRRTAIFWLALTKYSGNFGITHYGVEGMMSSLGYTTRLCGHALLAGRYRCARITTWAICGATIRKIWSTAATLLFGAQIRLTAQSTP